MKWFSTYTEPAASTGPIFRFGMLALCIWLLADALQVRARLSATYPHDPNGGTVVALMLLLNHLAFQFRWPRPVAVALRFLALAWLAFGCFYISYWSHRLYP